MRRKLFAGMMVFLAAVAPVVGSVKVGATEQPVASGVVVGEDESGNKEASDGETDAASFIIKQSFVVYICDIYKIDS